MNGINPAERASGDRAVHAVPPVPVPVASLRVGDIQAFHLVNDEDEPILVVSDGEIAVEFACGLAGLSGAAAQGVHRLADAVQSFAYTIEANVPR